MSDGAAVARRMWTLFEPVHVISYFAPPARDAFEQAGLRGFWRGYFAGRAAPIGRVGAAPVLAAFFSFAPVMVTRALPAVWELISPADAIAVRQAGAVAALRDLLGLGEIDPVPADVGRTARLLSDRAAGVDVAGRTLGASNAELPVPDEPLAQLWHAATVLREHRGDGHIAALIAADLDAPEALALRVGIDIAAAHASLEPGLWRREDLQAGRGWTDAEWDGAVARLSARGLLQADGAVTSAGAELHRDVEAMTDRAAARPWAGDSGANAADLAALLLPIAQACAKVLPFPNPVGVPAPS